MKIRLLFLWALLFAAGIFVQAQALITVPNDSSEITANVTDEFEPNDVHIYLVNNSSSSITVTWGLINYTAPAGWEVKLCDNNNCYDLLLFPGPYESLPIPAGDTMDMKFQYTAHLITGSASSNVYAYVTGDSANTVVFLNYKANLTAISGIAGNTAFSNLKLFPNPAVSTLLVSGFEQAGEITFELYSLKGEKLKSETKNSSDSKAEIPVQALPAGDYILKAFDISGKVLGVSRFSKTD